MSQLLMQRLKGSWRSLLAADIVFKLLALFLLTPVISLLFRVFLALSGRTILADVDIARFVLHPLGWLTTIIIGGLVVTLFAFEQSVLMAIAVAADHGKSLSLVDALRFAAGKSVGVFRIAARMVARLLLLSAPFLAAAAAAFLLLLRDHDINFYLAHKPPRFWIAAAIIGVSLAILAVKIVQRRVVNWSVAIQLHLFERLPARACLDASRARVLGQRKAITRWVIAWWVVNAVIGTTASACLLKGAQWFVPRFVDSIWQLSLALGGFVAIWGLVTLACNMLAVISFALMQVQVYERCGVGSEFQPPGDDSETIRRLPPLTLWRLGWACVAGVAVAALIGVITMRTVRLEDHVEITAHRAGAGRAPENTLAAVRQAIEDGADWIEIDVQEASDGIVVVIHDSDLSRVAGAPVKIWEATADELRSHDIGSYFEASYSAERVPTLDEVLELCRGRVKVNIELKFYGHDVALASKVVAIVEEHGMENDVVAMSLEPAQVQQVKALRPDWQVGLLTAVSAGDLTLADADFLAVSTKLATPAFVRRAHRRQRDVYAWTVNDALGMSTLISRGVDNIITDRPDIARRVLADRAALGPTERMLIDLAYRFGIVPAMHENSR